MPAEERLYTQYFYNSVIEFIYFTILYLEVFKTASLNNLIKHAKLFKIEVTNFISSFNGKSLETKLNQLLTTVECFVLVNDKVKLNKNVCLRDDFFEDLVLSKSVDLILKGIDSIDDIYKNLNFNNVIFISKQNLLHIIKKYSNISVNDKMITLHHFHGLLGFENSVCNSVISYFHDVLSHCKIFSVHQIENHSKYLTFCGNYNIMIIFSILNCSDQFIFQNGYVWLNGKSKKYPKQQPISVELMEAKFLSRSLSIGQIVYSIYGHSLYKWSGEIGNLTTSSGIIYCVVDFTNGSQGVFCITFNKASLKVISEIDNLEKCLHIRDAVEFDAEYNNGKKLDRCWTATRVRLLNNNKFEYDEVLCDNLNSISEQHRNQCVECYSSMYLNNYSLKMRNRKCDKRQSLRGENDYKLCSLNYSLSESNDIKNVNKCINQETENNFYATIYNFLIPDYVFMFGYVHMLMEDKIVAIAKHKNKIYNILFLKDCISPLNSSQNFVKGQKIIACIPYIKKMDPFPVAILVCGLNDQETNDTESNNILPKEFANKIFYQNTVSNLCNKFCSHHSFLKDLVFEQYKSDLKIKVEEIELYNFIKSQYKVSFQQNYLQQFLDEVSKTNSNGFNLSNRVFHFMVKLSKYFAKYVNQKKKDKIKHQRKLNSSQIDFNSQVFAHLQELCSNSLTESLTKKNVAKDSNIISETKSLDMIEENLTKQYNMQDINFYLKSKSLDMIERNITEESNIKSSTLHLKSKSLNMIQKCSTILRSFNTCSSSNSVETFYSCKTNSSSPKYLSNCSLDTYSSVTSTGTEELSNSTRSTEFEQKEVFPKIFYEDTIQSLESCQNIKKRNKSLKSIKKSYYQYLGLNSVPLLKQKVKKKGLMSPCVLKHVCKNCTINCSYNLKAYISMISKSFFFLSTNVNGHNVVLTMLKENIPEKIQENMKLKSSYEISVIPSALVNLSHIVSAKVIV